MAEKKIKMEVIVTLRGDDLTDEIAEQFVQECDYSFENPPEGIEIGDTEIRGFEIIQS